MLRFAANSCPLSVFNSGFGKAASGLMCRLVLLLATVVAWAVSPSGVARAAGSDTVGVYGNVTTVGAGGLIRQPANYFDLEGTTLRFTPNGADGYTVRVRALDWEDPGDIVAWEPSRGFWAPGRRPGPTVDLPFAFPFSGRRWTRAYVNVNGNISFVGPEIQHWPQRGRSAAMRTMAATIDSRSAAGLETMIAALWAIYGSTAISIDPSPARVAITWRAVRPSPDHNWHEPLGENLFQARLYPSGVVELAYKSVAERDGIVGLFHGMEARGRTLDSVEDEVGEVAPEEDVIDITKIELVDNGSTLLAIFTVAADVSEHLANANLRYRVILDFGDYTCDVGVRIREAGRSGYTSCDPAPGAVGYRVDGATIEIPISKISLEGARQVSWNADAVWWGRGFDRLSRPRTVDIGTAAFDLGALSGTLAGNAFEVFHYPSIPRQPRQVLSFIHSYASANHEIVVPFTGFRIDKRYTGGPGSGPINIPVQGIGRGRANPQAGELYRSDSLLVTMVPNFIGAPRFVETGVFRDREFRDFALGIRWIAHEAVHRWAAHLQFRNPQTGHVEHLTDEGCRCHWSKRLHVPAVHAVGLGYASAPYPERSTMGGSFWLDNGDGTFTQAEDAYAFNLPTGLSALDLYVLGMIPATQVPDTFLLRDVEATETRGRFKATKVPVRIDDIVAAMGPRVPAVNASRKEFRLGVFLLHEDGRPPRADLLQRAQAITTAIPRYFATATGGRMRLVPTVSTAVEPPSE